MLCSIMDRETVISLFFLVQQLLTGFALGHKVKEFVLFFRTHWPNIYAKTTYSMTNQDVKGVQSRTNKPTGTVKQDCQSILARCDFMNRNALAPFLWNLTHWTLSPMQGSHWVNTKEIVQYLQHFIQVHIFSFLDIVVLLAIPTCRGSHRK